MAVAIALAGGICDVLTGKIPNWLTLNSMAFGLVYGIFAGGFRQNLMGLLLGIGVYLPFYYLGYMGGGDVKMMGAIGCFCGVQGVIQTAILGSFYGGALAIIALAKKQRYIRYGVAIGLGLVTSEALRWLNLPSPFPFLL